MLVRFLKKKNVGENMCHMHMVKPSNAMSTARFATNLNSHIACNAKPKKNKDIVTSLAIYTCTHDGQLGSFSKAPQI
jgi:hypothetical protein